MAANTAYFNSIQLISATISRRLGTAPDTAVITFDMTPTPQELEQGTLTMYDGTTTLTFRDLDLLSVERIQTEDDDVWVAVLQDCRWKWNRRTVFGEYNRPDIDGVWRTDRNMKQLISLAGTAMVGNNPELLVIPVNIFGKTATGIAGPYARWENTPAGIALESLLGPINHAVGLDFNNRAVIVELGKGILIDDEENFILAPGKGAKLPTTKLTDRKEGWIRNRLCDGLIEIVGGQAVLQEDFATEPVGIDTDGEIKLLKDLSYAPSPGMPYGGFEDGKTNSLTFGWITNATTRELAERSVWKYYRITADPDTYLPLTSGLVERTQHGGQVTSLPHIVYVKDYTDFQTTNGVTTVATDVAYPYAHIVDLERGIVMFADQVMLIQKTDWSDLIPATVTLRASHESRTAGPRLSKDDFYSYFHQPAGMSDDEFERRKEEEVIYKYEIPEYIERLKDGTSENATELYAQSEEVASLLWNPYRYAYALTQKHYCLLSYYPDGLVWEMHWTITAQGGAETVAMINYQTQHYNVKLPSGKSYEMEPYTLNQLNHRVIGAMSAAARCSERRDYMKQAIMDGQNIPPGAPPLQIKPRGDVPITTRVTNNP